MEGIANQVAALQGGGMLRERPCRIRAYVDIYLLLECSSIVLYYELRLVD